MYETYNVGDKVRIANSSDIVFKEEVGDTGVVIIDSSSRDYDVCILFDRDIDGWKVEGSEHRYTKAKEIGLFRDEDAFENRGAWIQKQVLEKISRCNPSKIDWIE